MIKVYSSTDERFNYKECEDLYNYWRKELAGTWTFKETINNSLFFSFYDDEKFLGCIFYYIEDCKLFVGVYATRGHLRQNRECFKATLNLFNCAIYAHSVERTAIQGMYALGFEKIKDDLYVYRRK